MIFLAIAPLCGCSAGEDGEPNGGGTGGPDAGADMGNGGQQPSGDYCAPVADWPGTWFSQEEDVLLLVNQVRSQGADCGSEGSFGPAEPLVMDTSLRCAARVHSQDMYDRDYFDHQNPDGQTPWDRMVLAGYDWSRAGENIAYGASDADGAMSQWMSSPGHCANIMNPDFVHIGAGFQDDARLWTLVFGTP